MHDDSELACNGDLRLFQRAALGQAHAPGLQSCPLARSAQHVVKFIGSGTDTGSWAWSLLLTHPGPAFNRPTNGIVPTARDAAHELLDSYAAFRKWFGIEDGEGGR